uniref:Uncharacterized protein n=1 Tax=Timema cristinae TaxID=61476 RepID=A0A7R9CKJ4_TIMCR|nr:unnamed protein product [Timema cristinae]
MFTGGGNKRRFIKFRQTLLQDKPAGFDLPRRIWEPANRIGTNHDVCRDTLQMEKDIVNPKVPPGTKDAIKNFNYDYSYWSHNVVPCTITSPEVRCCSYGSHHTDPSQPFYNTLLSECPYIPQTASPPHTPFAFGLCP